MAFLNYTLPWTATLIHLSMLNWLGRVNAFIGTFIIFPETWLFSLGNNIHTYVDACTCQNKNCKFVFGLRRDQFCWVAPFTAAAAAGHIYPVTYPDQCIYMKLLDIMITADLSSILCGNHAFILFWDQWKWSHFVV